MAKVFLNSGILGGKYGIPEDRRMFSIKTENITPVAYNTDYFESIPTSWAIAYTFKQMLLEKNQDIVQEWVCLFLLHYFGVVRYEMLSGERLQAEYDKDFWSAISGTYPSPKHEKLTSLALLKTADEKTVGGYFPEVVFFPSRGHSEWPKSQLLKPYLEGYYFNKLSWKQSKQLLLVDKKTKMDFHLYLRRIALHMLEDMTLRELLNNFCDSEFGSLPKETTLIKLDTDITKWPHHNVTDIKYETLLEQYPLRKKKETGGYTYYLLEGMPEVHWMSTPIAPGLPSVLQYRKPLEGEDVILVDLGEAEPIRCKIGDNDRVELLRELFLSTAYRCKFSRNDSRITRIQKFHKLGAAFDETSSEETALCLLPVRHKFFKHFSELFKTGSSKITATADRETEDIVWSFLLPFERGEKEIKWLAETIGSTALPDSSLALWPPKVSTQWHFYAAYGKGNRQEVGRWFLIDENGMSGENIEVIEDYEYITFLQGGEKPNRPAAMMLKDSNNSECGVAVLTKFDEQEVFTKNASMAMDLGTSNTSFAYSIDESEPKSLLFSLSPEMVWGDPPAKGFDEPGFVPFSWNVKKGFYPTILLSRKGVGLEKVKPSEVQIKHVFQVDIPTLRSNIAQVMGGQLKEFWDFHQNLKWDFDQQSAYRTLFLERSLLYAHAEMFFTHHALPSSYVFTFPLAFSPSARKEFHQEARRTIEKLRALCCPSADKFNYVSEVDESTAIAASSRATAGGKGILEVFVDIGGGTSDIAIRHDNRFLVLDSVRVAGKSFFKFADKSFNEPVYGDAQFKKHLTKILSSTSEVDVEALYKSSKQAVNAELGTIYSVLINQTKDEDFTAKEGKILEEGMGRPSYVKYRSSLFFRHILTYALIQACAAVIDNKATLSNGINIILSGNAWGLLMFAELRRAKNMIKEECKQILKYIVDALLKSESLKDEEYRYLEKLHVFNITLLNEDDLKKAKTSVAIGALMALTRNGQVARQPEEASTSPYAGITMKNVKINEYDPITIRWCDRWGFQEIRHKVGFAFDQIDSFEIEEPQDLGICIDQLLSVFTCQCNIARPDKDQLPAEEWQSINSTLLAGGIYLQDLKPKYSPINYFLSKVLYPDDRGHYYLEELAKINKTFKPAG